ncbi:unnamed protein product [Cyprideis torosa]|uniref:Calcium channel flower n=1 Tax=Cyprideis torosa TaxID=163714 RepID=A0A7R8W8L7_9CRUS|nr:unnamed protein product [Cyprideis torosa]CAG0886360.1 unnamed protein product [Cyprideis torosa]
MFETGIPQGQEGETNSLETGKDDTPWWLKYAGRGCGIVGGLLAMLLGLFNIITFSASCLVAGILQMITGAIVASIEGPCLCHFSQRAQQVSDMIEGRPKWNRAALYIVGARADMLHAARMDSELIRNDQLGY